MITRDDYEREARLLFEKLMKLHRGKSAGYGGEADIFRNLTDFGWKGVIIRLDDKMNRLKNLVFSNTKNKQDMQQIDESFDETLIDLIGYGFIIHALRILAAPCRFNLTTGGSDGRNEREAKTRNK